MWEGANKYVILRDKGDADVCSNEPDMMGDVVIMIWSPGYWVFVFLEFVWAMSVLWCLISRGCLEWYMVCEVGVGCRICGLVLHAKRCGVGLLKGLLERCPPRGVRSSRNGRRRIGEKRVEFRTDKNKFI